MSTELRSPQPLPPPEASDVAATDATRLRGAAAPPDGHPPTTPSVSAVLPTQWLAVLGSSLLLLAAILVVTSRWRSIGDAWKAAGLAVATGVIVALAEWARRRIPVTSGVVAHLGAAMVCPAGVAVAAASGGTWPLCITVGGTIGAAAMEIQDRRWGGRLMGSGQVLGIALALAGVAATTPIPVGVLAAVASMLLLVVRRPRRAVGLAYLAGAAPLLWFVAEAGWGRGTLLRIGTYGTGLRWGAPAAGVIAALVIVAASRGDVGRRHRRCAWVIALGNIQVGLATWEFWQRLSDWLHHQQVRPADGVMFALTAGLFALAHWGSATAADRNVFHTIGLAFSGLWTVARIVDAPTAAWISIGFALGLGAAAIGGRRNDRVMLVGGSAITVATAIATLHGPLSQLPGWAWLALGGAGLVAFAARLERKA